MTTSQSTIDFLLDQLSRLPSVRMRKMFGDYALYCDDKVVALVCDNRVFLKPTPAGRALVGMPCEEGCAYPGAKPSIVLGAEFLEDAERLCELIRATADALPRPPLKTARRASAKTGPKRLALTMSAGTGTQARKRPGRTPKR